MITRQGLEASASQLVPAGTLIVCTRMAPGSALIFQTEVAINQDMKALICNKETSPGFLRLVLNFKKKELVGISSGSTVAGLGISDLTALRISLPPLKEQEAIAEALSDADAAIESLDALIAKKRDVKQAAMQQLLTGRTRLPGFTADWKEVRLGEIAEIISGGTPSTAIGAYWGGDIPWCTPTDITSCKSNYLFDTERKITPAGLAGSAASLLPPGSLLLCTRATVGDVRIAGRAIATNQGFKSLVVNSQANSKFVYFVLQTLRQAMIEKSSGSTFLELGKNDLSNIVALMPPVKEQEAIAEALTVIDDELEALTEQVSKLRMVTEGMMQDLLTGKVRLV